MDSDHPHHHPAAPSGQADFDFAYAGLFMAIFSLTQAGLIAHDRAGLYLPGRLLFFCVSLFLGCAFGPFALPPAWRKRFEGREYAYPLISFGLMMAALAALGLGGQGRLLIYFYGGLALVGSTRGLARLGGMSARHWAFLPVAALLGAYVFHYFTPWNYAGVYAPEKALLGLVRKDTYFAASIAHLIQNYGVSSTGLDGLVRLHYHIGSHAWFAALGKAAGTMPLLTYPFAHLIVLIPAQFLALSFSMIAVAPGKRSAIVNLAGALLMVLITDALGRPSHYVSESFAAGVTGLLFFWPLLVDLMARPERGRREDAWRLAVALLAVFILNSIKISVGMLWTLALGWTLLRNYRLGPRALIGVPAAGLIAFAGLKIFSDPGQAAIFAPFKFFASHPRLLFFYNWIIPGWFLAAILMARKITGLGDLWRAARARSTLGAEVIALMALAAAAPAFLLWLSIAWAWFFFNVPQWPAMSMLFAAWEWGPLLGPRFRWVTYPVAAVLIAAVVMVTGPFLWSTLGTEGLAKAREIAGSGDEAAWPAASASRPYGTGLESRLAAAPGYQAYASIMDAAAGQGRDFAVYAPASNRKFWGIVKNCEAQPLFVSAVTGKPMLYGLLPPGTPCDLEFYGYPDYGPDAFARDLDDAAICRHARAKKFSTVFVLADLDRPGLNRRLECDGPPD